METYNHTYRHHNFSHKDLSDREHKKYWGSVSYAAIAGPFPSL